jgi:hypothetical protein
MDSADTLPSTVKPEVTGTHMANVNVCESGQVSDKINAGQLRSNDPALFLDSNCFGDDQS